DDGVLALEYHGDAGPRAHEIAEAAEEGPLAVDVVEPLGLGRGEPAQTQRDHFEAGLLEPGEDLHRLPSLHRVGLDVGISVLFQLSVITSSAAIRRTA